MSLENSNKPPHKEEGPETENRKTDAEPNLQPPSISPEVGLEGVMVKQPDTDDSNHYRLQRANLRVQIGLLIATTLTFLAAIIYAGIAHRQWSTMDQTFQEIQKQTVSAKTSANAAKSASETANKTLTEIEKQSTASAKTVELATQNMKAVQDQFRLDQRAWINITEARFREPLSAKTNNHIDLSLKNTGKTPALQVVYKYKTWIQVSGKTIAELEKVGNSETVYGPGDVRPTVLSWTSPMSQKQVDMLESKKGTFFVDIEFAYRDIFDARKLHHNRACLFYDPIISINLALAFCDHGCYMD
jgi:hypothetical protein